MESLGGPVRMDPFDLGGIDPCLEDCCRREVESNRRYNALTSTLRRHDTALLAERRRRNLIKTPEFEGCRCCYDPNSDGGEYRALIELKEKKKKEQQNQNAGDEEDGRENTSSYQIENGDFASTLEQKQQNNDNDKDYNHSDDEFDYLLDEDIPGEDETIKQLEDNRRAELEFQILMRQIAGQHGYGAVRQIHPTRVLKVAGLGMEISSGRTRPPAVVLHLVDPDSTASASLDYYLETELANEYPGTVFLRSEGRSTLLMDAGRAQISFPSSIKDAEGDIPALLAIRDGVVTNACPRLQGLTSSSRSNEDCEVEPNAVRQWLERSGVLLSDVPRLEEVCSIRLEEEALLDYLVSSQPSHQTQHEEERYDCGLEGCNKSFKHEHIGIQTSEQDGLVVKEETILGSKD